MKKFAILGSAFLLIGLLTAIASAQTQKIYWGDSVPKRWNGNWPVKFLTVPERTRFERTASSTEVLEFIDVLRWNSDKVAVINMFTTSLRRVGTAVVLGVEFMTKPAGTVAATVPRGYFIPAELDFVAEKLRTHNVKVEVLTKPIKAAGEEFVIDRIGQGRGGGAAMIKLEGGFAKSPLKEFPAGTFRVDLAQPMANVAFYCLEPQAADGFAGWGVLDNYFKTAAADKKSIVYPIYKYFKIMD